MVPEMCEGRERIPEGQSGADVGYVRPSRVYMVPGVCPYVTGNSFTDVAPLFYLLDDGGGVGGRRAICLWWAAAAAGGVERTASAMLWAPLPETR